MTPRLLLPGACVAAALTLSYSANAHEQTADTARPDAHAPIGVMRDHVHKQGEVMLSYRYMFTEMDGNRDGTSSVSDAAVLRDFMVAPTRMPMRMHMFGAMAGVTDQLTVGAMGGVMAMEMDHVRRDGSTFRMESDGFSDTKLNAMYEFFNNGTHRMQFNAGLSLPTGSVDERKPNGMIFAYPMQLGSGTYDLLPGVSYSGSGDTFSWGGQVNGVFRLGDNDRGYTLGDRYHATAWGAYKATDFISLSLRVSGEAWDDIDGRDRELPAGPMFMAPPMNPDLQDGERVEMFAGLNFIVPEGPLKGNRLAAEAGVPVYERLDGPRLETDYRLIFGWQYAF